MVVVTERRRSGTTWIAALGVLAAAGSFILVAPSAHLVRPTAYAVQLALLILGATGAALVWRARRRGNRLDIILLAIAAAAAGISLQGASQPVLHSIGVLFDPLVFALGYYLALAFPDARLDGAVARTLFGAIVGITFFSFVPWFFFSPYVAGGAPLARCTAACPQNGLMIADRPSIANAFGHAEELLSAGIVAAIAVYLVARLIAAPRPRRRALVPVYVPTLFLAVPYVIFHLAQAGVIDVAAVNVNRIGWLVTVGRTTLALGPAFAVALTTYFAGRALKGIVERLGASPSVAELRRIVADALDDPTLELAFGIGPGGGLFVDTRGNPLTPALLASTARPATPILRGGATVAFVLHDPALNTDPELVQAAGLSVLLALENGRLERELRSSRLTAAAAADDARRKVERDLHDGAQQGLISLIVRMNLAHGLSKGEPIRPKQLESWLEQLKDVLEDLRQLGQGVSPILTGRYGLAHALEAAAARAVPPAEVEIGRMGVHSMEIQEAAYFCCLEALQNVAKHAGRDAHATVRVRERAGELEFEVVDTGVGFDSRTETRDRSGLMNARARLLAVGGSLQVESVPGHGAVVRGRIPVVAVRNDTAVSSGRGGAQR